MRRFVAVSACALALLPFALAPQSALASPYARAGVWAQAATQPNPSDPSLQPTSSKAPKSKDLEMPEKPEPEPEKAPEPTPEPEPTSPEPAKPQWTRHGFGIRGGISVIPSGATADDRTSRSVLIDRWRLGRGRGPRSAHSRGAAPSVRQTDAHASAARWASASDSPSHTPRSVAVGQ